MNARIAALIVGTIGLTAFTTAFALINYTNQVKVWPLMTQHPLTFVIGISFLLGGGVGALISVIVYHYRMVASAR